MRGHLYLATMLLAVALFWVAIAFGGLSTWEGYIWSGVVAIQAGTIWLNDGQRARR